MELASEFVAQIKQECVMKQFYFSFFDIPDLIIKKNYSRKDYEETILKVLNKTKMRYLAEKKNDCGTPIEKLQVTDEDLIPFELLDAVLTEIEHKHSEKV